MKYQITPQMAKFNEDGFVIVAGYVLVYNTDPLTGEFTKSTYEYVAEGLGIPPSVSLEAPNDVDDGYAIVRENNKWKYPRDYRGNTIYSIVTGESVLVTEIGNIPDGFTLLKPASEFDVWNGEEWVLDEEKKRQHDLAVLQLQQSQLIKEANNEISNLQDAVDADIATDQQVETLKKWKKYRFELNNIDMTTFPNINWPLKPNLI